MKPVTPPTVTKFAVDVVTPKERLLLEALASGLSSKAALERAGYAVSSNHHRYVKNVLTRPRVAEEWGKMKKKTRRRMEMSRERVQDMVMKAFDLAESVEDPNAMVRAAAEINKMCGFYAPEEKVVTLSEDAKELQHQLHNMSEKELLRLKGENDALDAEFELVSDERITKTLGDSVG